jgi:hypothetical protein
MTPHDRLYALTLEAARDPANVRKSYGEFVVTTSAGRVGVDSQYGTLDGLMLNWSDAACERLWRRCLDAYMLARLPPDTAHSTKPVNRPWWRRLWTWIRPRRVLPRARLLRPGDL